MAESEFDPFIEELLVRIAAIQGDVDTTKELRPSPYYFEPMDADGFPCTRNRKMASTYDHTQGNPMRRDVILVEMSIVAGPASAGYKNQYERKLNTLYMPLVNRFDKVPKLNDPVTGEALRFVQKAMIISDTGTIGFRFDEQGALFFGARLTLQVTCNFAVPRTS
jgi:hypothetical protein